jgi:hypothetical protein
MRLLITASFAKATKKLHTPQKTELDAAPKLISKDPIIGQANVGDLFTGSMGVYVYKFKISQQECLLAYRIVIFKFFKLNSHSWISPG